MITFMRLGRLGRLGNQMFEYAALLGIAQQNGYDFGVPYGNPSFCLPKVFPGLTAKDCLGQPVRHRYVEKRDPAGHRGTGAFEPEVFKISDGTDLCGYFQSEGYFAHGRARLLREFQPLPQYEQAARHWLGDLRGRVGKPIVFAHVRRGDYLKDRLHYVQPLSYYRKARGLLPDGHVLVLSDDLGWCRENFAGEPDVSFSPFSDPFVDLQLMRLCDHGIIANSSFSWWGAWLGENPGRKVIAPALWYRFDVNQSGRRKEHCEAWQVL